MQDTFARKASPSQSKLACLNPFVDEDGLIRANSRLAYADYLPYDAKYPVILPRSAWVTKLIVGDYHSRNGHVAGTNLTFAAISERFWIIHGREVIRQVERECFMCRRRKAKVASQLMAPLPKIRLQVPLRAFARTAVDFAGPFITMQGRGRKRAKRYLCLFTCLDARAVHLEVAYGLDTDSFLNAFYRMTCRRGTPLEVMSDNGTNFVGAANELRDLLDAMEKQKIRKYGADRAIKWHFIPPHAPHFGGVHESMIKSAKRAIYAILGNADVT
jgi:Integrase zinc binding domain